MQVHHVRKLSELKTSEPAHWATVMTKKRRKTLVVCADCHGLDAGGYRGPDLNAVLAGGATDDRLFQTIRKGVPGTEMPSTTEPDDDILMIIAYLRKIGTVAPETPTGSVENGTRLFTAQCASCHRVAGRGIATRGRRGLVDC